jgi:glycosyltransferase involved in cell wall biosynthesis
MKQRVLVLTTEWPTDRNPDNGIFVREFTSAASLVADVAVVAVERERPERGLYQVKAMNDGFHVQLVRYRRFRKPVSIFAFILGTRAAIRAAGHRFDVVHTHSFLSTLLARVLMPRTPVVYTEHWSIFLPEDPGELGPAMRVLARVALQQAQVVLPPSDAQRQALARIAPRGRFRIVPNVVDVSLFTPQSRKRVRAPQLVSVAMMTEDRSKGIDFLLRALALLAHAGQDVALHLAGDGPRRAEYEALAGDLGILDRVTFHGFLTKPQVADVLRRSDLFVLASRFENNPCALIEAMASGLPVVATRVGGVPEMVDAGTGILVKPQSPEALADGIRRALERLAEFDREAIAAGAHDRYGRERIAGELAVVYDEAVGRD